MLYLFSIVLFISSVDIFTFCQIFTNTINVLNTTQYYT